MNGNIKVGMAQLAPVWLNKTGCIEKVKTAMIEAANEKADLLVFGEGFLPGYPFWLALTDGAKWDLEVNKTLHAHYAKNAIQLEAGDLDTICALAKELETSPLLGHH